MKLIACLLALVIAILLGIAACDQREKSNTYNAADMRGTAKYQAVAWINDGRNE